MNLQLLLALATSACCAALGQVMLKLGATGRTELSGFVNLQLLSGIALYILGTAIWIYALSRLPLNVVYPFTLLTLGLVLVLSIVFLGERPSATVLVGWLVIGAGIALVAVGSRG